MSSNLELLELAANALQPLLPELVFLGGCTTELFFTDPSVTLPRATWDVDVLVEIASYADYVGTFTERLHRLGFAEDDRPGSPNCRWVKGQLTLDAMPVDARVLGFSNRWYADGIRNAVSFSLPSGTSLAILCAPYFLATKLEAFAARGKGDLYASHDLEDILAVVDGREEIVQECLASDVVLLEYLRERFSQLLRNGQFRGAVEGSIGYDPGGKRFTQTFRRFQGIAGLIP